MPVVARNTIVCKFPRNALREPMQCFASANAMLCVSINDFLSIMKTGPVAYLVFCHRSYSYMSCGVHKATP